jgi:hypothetical protein
MRQEAQAITAIAWVGKAKGRYEWAGWVELGLTFEAHAQMRIHSGK